MVVSTGTRREKSIFNGIQRFAQAREERLGSQRAELQSL